MGLHTTGNYEFEPKAVNSSQSSKEMGDSSCDINSDRLCRRSIVVVLWALCISFLGCTLSGKIPPKRMAFPCNPDNVTIRPFYGDTISGAALFSTLFVAPLLVFAITESVVEGYEEMFSGFRRSFSVLGDFISGFFYVFTITELLKVLVSEQRPHFFYTCRPDWKNIGCFEGFATQYNCTGEGPWWLVQVDIYKSFPSGHASLSFYTFVFVSAYLHLRYSKKTPFDLIRPWIQLLFFCWTLACCYTRITDNRHYWWDVLAGVFLGMLGGLYMIRYSRCKTFGCLIQQSTGLEKDISKLGDR